MGNVFSTFWQKLQEVLFNKKPIRHNLKHCKVPKVWEDIRDRAWEKASTVLSKAGYKPITQCKKIRIQRGEKANFTTGQWGCPMKMPDGTIEWYAGYGNKHEICNVGAPDGQPYGRSQGIFNHEAGENILSSNGVPEDDHEWRNKLLWSLKL